MSVRVPPKPKLCPHGVLGVNKCRTCVNARRDASRYRDAIKYRVTQAASSAACGGHPWADGQRLIAEGHLHLLGGDRCEVCGREGRTHLDHDHVTGRFRGVLCEDCNRALGSVGDSIDRLRKLISYLTCRQ